MTRMDGTFTCQAANGSGWSEIAGGPNTYIVGNCRDGWQLARTFKSDVIAGRTYEGGYINGDFNACGWLLTTDDVAVNTTDHHTICADSTPRDPATYISLVDCKSGESCSGDPDLSGWRGTPVVATCQAWANARPFSANGATHLDAAQWITPQSTVGWRYVTADGRMVLIHDFSHPANQPPWVFVDRGCLGPLPHRELLNPPALTNLGRYRNGADHGTFTGWQPAGYVFEGSLGRTLSAPEVGTYQLFECLFAGWDFFTSTSADCEGQTMVGSLGWIYGDPNLSPYFVGPLYRCRTASGEHFDAGSGCEGQSVEGFLGYVV